MPMPVFDRTYFHPTYLDLFWQLLTERMHVYWRREAGDPPPWTADPILRTEFITNVYRELDPGTKYAQTRILHDEDIEDIDKVFNTMLYRLMGSRVEFHEHLEIYQHDTFDGVKFAETCKEIEREHRLSPFGEAYRTAAYSDYGSKEKITNVGLLLGQTAEYMPRLMAELGNAQTLQQCFQYLEAVRGYGEFLAYQVMVDLLYPAPFDPLLPFDDNTWAMAGPGARRGIWQMMTPGMKPQSMLEVMVWLRDNQHEEFERLGLDFPFLRDGDDNPIPISLCNIQASLCEFFKYARIWNGEIRAVRKYFYSEAQVSEFNEPSVITVEKPGHEVGVGAVVVGAVGPEVSGGGEHLGLGGSTVPSSELLDGSAGYVGNQNLSSPQTPAHNASGLHSSQVSELAGSNGGLLQTGVRLHGLDEAQNLRAQAIQTLLEHLVRSGLGIDEANRLVLAAVGNGSGTGQADVETNGNKTVHYHFHLS